MLCLKRLNRMNGSLQPRHICLLTKDRNACFIIPRISSEHFLAAEKNRMDRGGPYNSSPVTKDGSPIPSIKRAATFQHFKLIELISKRKKFANIR